MEGLDENYDAGYHFGYRRAAGRYEEENQALRSRIRDLEGKLQEAEMKLKQEEKWHHQEIDNLKECLEKNNE